MKNRPFLDIFLVILLVALVVADARVTFPSRPSSIKYRDKLLAFAALVGGCTHVFQKSSMMKRGDDLAQCAMRVLAVTFSVSRHYRPISARSYGV
jgi:hypothetical protein